MLLPGTAPWRLVTAPVSNHWRGLPCAMRSPRAVMEVQWHVARPEAKGGEEDAPHLASALLRKAAPGLARDVDTAGEIVHNTAHALGNIGEGMAKALDVKDTKVRPKAPVKMLTHV